MRMCVLLRRSTTFLLFIAGAFGAGGAFGIAVPVAAQSMTAMKMSEGAFSVLSSTRKILSASDLDAARHSQAVGVVTGNQIAFSGSDLRLIVTTGPEDDMLSYRVQSVRNPTLVVPPHATLRILFVNADDDMTHDWRVGSRRPPFPAKPDLSGTMGSSRLMQKIGEKYNAEEIVLQARQAGNFLYFCSVPGHARGGMWGILAVGASPDPSLQNNSAPAAHHEEGEHAAHDHAAMEHGATDHAAMNHEGHEMHAMGRDMMRSTIDLNDTMSRESSGTSWLPDSSPMYMRMKMRGQKMTMLHGVIFPRYTRAGSDRDASIAGKGSRSRFDAPSMFMGMYAQPAGEKGQIGVRLMTSADPFIERGYGYPLLYQSGEAYKGLPLHDRQHPHDLISELSVSYSRKLGTKNSAYLYLGYPGEPALGPPTFMHRISAMDNPDAPISHHWQDSTHITFGVLTAGYSMKKWKLEGSVFNGSEPDENRYNFDSPKLNSYAGRLSWNPNANWALQVSHGYLKEPEELEPGVNQHRTTASAIYNKPLGDDANWSNALVWGQNDTTGEGKTNSYLFETNLQRGADTIYARLERVQKTGHELVLPAPDDTGKFGVGSYAVGYVRDLKHGDGLDVGLGAQVTFNTNPSALNVYYGGRNHTGFQVFLRIRPSRHNMEAMSGMGAMNGMQMQDKAGTMKMDHAEHH